MEKRLFGKTPDGTEIFLYSFTNKNGMKAEVMNYGAILVNLFVPDANGKTADVVLGYDNLEQYFKNGSFFGATVGPIANRTANAQFVVDNAVCKLAQNDNQNNLHSDFEQGFHKRVWNAECTDKSVTFSLKKDDMDLGVPGNMKVCVTYTLTDQNELKIEYQADSDKNTVINMTNHSYFNLSGHNSGDIHDNMLKMNASYYTPVVKGAIPTGEIAPVKGTPMDFTEFKRVGDEIDSSFTQTELVGGYDHNWVTDNWDGSIREIAQVRDIKSGRNMKVFTDLPGVQFYAGNFIGKKDPGKEGAVYGPRKALCLETQYYPNSANEENFPRPFFGPDKQYRTTTIYQFC